MSLFQVYSILTVPQLVHTWSENYNFITDKIIDNCNYMLQLLNEAEYFVRLWIMSVASNIISINLKTSGQLNGMKC